MTHTKHIKFAKMVLHAKLYEKKCCRKPNDKNVPDRKAG